MVTSTQIANTGIFTFIAPVVFKLLSHKVKKKLFKHNYIIKLQKLLKSRILLKKIPNFSGKLLEN